jgi:OmpA-OmpF porin, OOP family
MIVFCKPLAIAMAVSVLAACAPASRVILLPEPGGRVSAVEVKSSKGALLLSQPYQSALVSAEGDIKRAEATPIEVLDRYARLISVPFVPEQRFLMYFETGGSRLTPASEAQLSEVLARVQSRPGGEIVITGHTDRVGSVEANDALSLQRASAIRELLVARGFKPELIEAVGRGEREPLVPTDDEVNEPRNRRADIVIR